MRLSRPHRTAVAGGSPRDVLCTRCTRSHAVKSDRSFQYKMKPDSHNDQRSRIARHAPPTLPALKACRRTEEAPCWVTTGVTHVDAAGITHVVVMIGRPRKVACAQRRAQQGALCACTLQTRASRRRVPSWGQLSRTQTSRSEREMLAAHDSCRESCAHRIKTWVSQPTFSRNSPPRSGTSLFERFPRSLYHLLVQQAALRFTL